MHLAPRNQLPPCETAQDPPDQKLMATMEREVKKKCKRANEVHINLDLEQGKVMALNVQLLERDQALEKTMQEHRWHRQSRNRK